MLEKGDNLQLQETKLHLKGFRDLGYRCAKANNREPGGNREQPEVVF